MKRPESSLQKLHDGMAGPNHVRHGRGPAERPPDHSGEAQICNKPPPPAFIQIRVTCSLHKKNIYHFPSPLKSLNCLSETEGRPLTTNGRRRGEGGTPWRSSPREGAPRGWPLPRHELMRDRGVSWGYGPRGPWGGGWGRVHGSMAPGVGWRQAGPRSPIGRIFNPRIERQCHAAEEAHNGREQATRRGNTDLWKTNAPFPEKKREANGGGKKNQK